VCERTWTIEGDGIRLAELRTSLPSPYIICTTKPPRCRPLSIFVETAPCVMEGMGFVPLAGE